MELGVDDDVGRFHPGERAPGFEGRAVEGFGGGRTQVEEHLQGAVGHHQVVHLAEHGNDVGQQVDGRDEVQRRDRDDRLDERRHPRLAQQPPGQTDIEEKGFEQARTQ